MCAYTLLVILTRLSLTTNLEEILTKVGDLEDLID